MTSRTRTDLTIDTIRLNATTIATLTHRALRAMDEQRGGYPATVPGAAPASSPAILGRDDFDEDGNPDPVRLTQPEAGAVHRDQASSDHARTVKLLADVMRLTDQLARLVSSYATPGITTTDVARAIVAVPLPTDTCRTGGCDHPPADGRTECRWCQAFRLAWGVSPTKGIIAVREYRTVTTADIERHLDRDVPDWRKKRPKSAGAA